MTVKGVYMGVYGPANMVHKSLHTTMVLGPFAARTSLKEIVTPWFLTKSENSVPYSYHSQKTIKLMLCHSTLEWWRGLSAPITRKYAVCSSDTGKFHIGQVKLKGGDQMKWGKNLLPCRQTVDSQARESKPEKNACRDRMCWATGLMKQCNVTCFIIMPWILEKKKNH